MVALINDANAIITSGHTSAIFPAVLLLKQIVIINLLNEDMSNNIYLKSNLAECKNLDDLPKLLNDTEYTKPSKKQLETFLEKTVFRFDGKCSKRGLRVYFHCFLPEETYAPIHNVKSNSCKLSRNKRSDILR